MYVLGWLCPYVMSRGTHCLFIRISMLSSFCISIKGRPEADDGRWALGMVLEHPMVFHG